MLVCLLQELGLSGFSSERTDSEGPASKEGEQWRTLFATFYKLVYEHIASLVEVSTLMALLSISQAVEHGSHQMPFY